MKLDKGAESEAARQEDKISECSEEGHEDRWSNSWKDKTYRGLEVHGVLDGPQASPGQTTARGPDTAYWAF